MTRTALFAGSFDPFTKGHLSTLNKALPLFDQIVVAVMTNKSKHYQLSEAQRVAIIKDAVAVKDKVTVVARSKMLTTDLAHDLKAQFLIRGLRNSEDLTYEAAIAAMNQQLAPDIETVFFLTDPKLAYVSSSMIKEVLAFDGDVSAYLTPLAAQLLQTCQQKNEAER